ncbi:hypothetical protein EBAPG3_008340 [Nitrosospira lacus]|uniref:Uncharacterized protein n=1 Tax=Nitrosospira lacus TaxID=1288494 RepID=A0A1W6SPP6_9PROT|nr:hypothetical protein [Nitrosospira lacus]ARO87775.1 hypothetical protein EBAPG3_008340 [Nitrosospira lacus]
METEGCAVCMLSAPGIQLQALRAIKKHMLQIPAVTFVPAAYAMMLAGLALMDVMARSKKQAV